jgi:hypothetical protein
VPSHTGSIRVVLLIAVLLPLMRPAFGQTPAGGGRGRGAAATTPAAPSPRFSNGTVNLGAVPGGNGFWNVNTGSFVGRGGVNLPTNPLIEDVPFQPWAKAVYEYRNQTQTKDDPHARCMPDGGIRLFQMTNGMEFIQQPELNRIISISGHNRVWRVIYMEPGRKHPEGDELLPSYMGDSIGHWEGDTLVIDTVGFNERFWFSRGGFPHTEELHLIERLTRLDMNTLKYEVTIDDPGAYTKPWGGGWTIRWQTTDYDNSGVGEIDEYFCMDNEKDSRRLIGQ